MNEGSVLLICGSRNLRKKEYIKDIQAAIDTFGLSNVRLIVSGCARGIDELAIEWAQKKMIPVQKFPADWKRLGNSAGSRRNIKMAEYLIEKSLEGHKVYALALPDGYESRGTNHMISCCIARGITVYIWRAIGGVFPTPEEVDAAKKENR